MFNPRGHALGFAERTRKNLAHIERGFDAGADVHVVTLLANSLLGLIVLLAVPRSRRTALSTIASNTGWRSIRNG